MPWRNPSGETSTFARDDKQLIRLPARVLAVRENVDLPFQYFRACYIPLVLGEKLSGGRVLDCFRRAAFTLLELLVVIGIIALLLVAVIPAVTSLSKSSGRKGAISNLLGAIEQARVEAIKTGQPSYLVFPTFTSAPAALLDRYHYKAYAIFVDDPAHPGTPKQVTNWKTLPTGISLRAAGDAGLSGLAKPATLTPPITLVFTPAPGSGTENFYCIKFNASGEVELPPAPPNNVQIAVFEGRVDGAAEIKTSANVISEGITIARLTGRAERSP